MRRTRVDRMPNSCGAPFRVLQNLRAIAIHAHNLIAKLKNIRVRRLELKWKQSRLYAAALYLAQKFCARSARNTARGNNDHIR